MNKYEEQPQATYDSYNASYFFDLFSDNLDFLNPFSVTVPQKVLVDALTAIGLSIASRSTLPILGNVKLEAKDGSLLLHTTNLDTCSLYRLPADVTQGAVTVSYKELLSLVKPLKGQTLTISQQEESTGVVIQANGFSAPLSGMDAGEFPSIPQINDKVRIPLQSVTLPVEAFKRLVGLTWYAASEDESRPVFTAICVNAQSDRLEMAAADAFRLSVARESVPGTDYWDLSLLISAKTLHEIAKRLPKTGVVTISTEESDKVTIQCGDLTVYSRLIEGTFPNFQQIIPRETTINATIDTQGLKTALQSVKGVAWNSSNITRLHLNGALEVKAQTGDMKEPMSVHVDAKTSGQELDIILNWKYLNEVLNANPGKEIQLGLNGGTKPAKVTFPDVPGFQHVIMPMHTNR